jgi:hypothetical protein
LYNISNHDVLILPYKSGKVEASDTIRLNQGDDVKIADGWFRGDIKIPSFLSEYFGAPGDSIIVIFDDQYSVTHYSDAPKELSFKHYLFSSLRNIGNPESYTFNRVKDGSTRINVHDYYFTESDYEYAKE